VKCIHTGSQITNLGRVLKADMSHMDEERPLHATGDYRKKRSGMFDYRDMHRDHVTASETLSPHTHTAHTSNDTADTSNDATNESTGKEKGDLNAVRSTDAKSAPSIESDGVNVQSETTNNSPRDENHQVIIKELYALRSVINCQTKLQSVRWGLANLELVESCLCQSSGAGLNSPVVNLRDLVKTVLVEFLKGRSCNVGNRHLKGDDTEEGCAAFRSKLCEAVLLLTGTDPHLIPRSSGEYDIHCGNYNL